jgi:very-short-patch-repair endonuclease
MATTITDFDKKVLDLVNEKPGYKASTIALLLEVDAALVNASLRGPLRGRVRKVWEDRSFRWYPRQSNVQRPVPPPQATPLDTPLARLCRYYLDCLSHDDMGGVSVFAVARPGTSDYAELPLSPFAETFNPFDAPDSARLLGKVRNNPNQLALFVGYPVRLRHVQTQRWSGFFVEPIMLFPFQELQAGAGNPRLSDDLPLFNFKALGSLGNTKDTSVIEESFRLSEEVGLECDPADAPDIEELLERLREVRPGWDWQEEISANTLSEGVPLPEIQRQGIFNRCVLVVAERSKYTRGLETELKALQTKKIEEYDATAVGQWLSGATVSSTTAEDLPLLEVLPLNSEQRVAVRQALTNQLTVLTGPPGTGKSQVVASILVNAAFQGQTVLFASKNNKAVDVVESRVNALGPRPILLRLGANKYQTAVAQYLANLLSAQSTQEDAEEFDRTKALHKNIEGRSLALDEEFQALIELRNEVDALEQEIEPLREALGNVKFSNVRQIDMQDLRTSVQFLQSAIRAAQKSKQGLVVKTVWPILRRGRLNRLSDAFQSFGHYAHQLELQLPSEVESAAHDWERFSESLDDRLAQVERAKLYFQKLNDLTAKESIADLSRKRRALIKELSALSARLWDSWLRLQPTRITQAQRQLIGNYTALLEMITGAAANGGNLNAGIFAQYYRLFPQIAPVLSCWAVTALAARGKLPFDPGFFDLLVIDEASQCDIASAIPLLYRAKRAIIIGDSMQLPHISGLAKAQDQRLLERHGLLENRAGWSYSSKSLFDLAASLCRPEDILMIQDHFRSHADIIQFSNETFYDGKLRLATPYDKLRRPYPDGPAVRWIDVQGEVVRPWDGGAVNDAEARAVVLEIERLIQQGYQGTIGVVSPFRAQANRIRDIISQNPQLAAPLVRADFLVDVVHSFQGDERDVIIFSPVISRNTPRGALWFVDSSAHKKRLFNVSITRARAALIVVGDKSALSQSESSHLKQFVVYVESLAQHRHSEVVSYARDLGEVYPVVAHPEWVSDYERPFYTSLYRRLRSRNIWPMPQYSVDKYWLDFALRSGQRMLDIEIDGERHHRSWDGELCRRDQIRNIRLMELGWDVMRFWVYQVRDDLDRCLDRVEAWCDNRGC